MVSPDLLRPGKTENACTTPSNNASFIPVVVLAPTDLDAYLCNSPVIIKKTPMIAVMIPTGISSRSRLKRKSGAPIAPVNSVDIMRKVIRAFGSELLLAGSSLR